MTTFCKWCYRAIVESPVGPAWMLAGVDLESGFRWICLPGDGPHQPITMEQAIADLLEIAGG